MQPNFTLKLISFIHHETTSEENEMVIEKILSDSEVHDDYQEMMEMTEMLRKIKFRPRKKIVKDILAYSEKTAREL